MGEMRTLEDPVSNEDIDAILRLAPRLLKSSFKPGEWIASDGKLPYVNFAPPLSKLHKLAYKHGFVAVFEWIDWTDEGHRLENDPMLIAVADLQTIRKLFTMIFRSERFSEGSIAEAWECGVLAAILHRLAAIRATR